MSYDPAEHAACPECLAADPSSARDSTRPSQLETQRPASPSLGAGLERRTTRRFPERAITRSRPSQLDTQRPQLLATQRPRPPVSSRARAATPTSSHWPGVLGLGALAGLVVLGYRSWAESEPADAAAQALQATAANSAEAANEGSEPSAAPPARNLGDAPAPDLSALDTSARNAAVRVPAVRHLATPGDVPAICRVPWLEMFAKPVASPSGAGAARQLMTAAESGSLESLHALLDAGAEVDARDELGRTALMLAARERRNAHVQALMRAGADGRARGLWDAQGGSLTALDAALLASARDTAELIEREVLRGLLSLRGPDLASIDEAGDGPLHWVARYGGARMTQILLDRGAAREARNCPARPGDERGLHRGDPRAATPLLIAVWSGNVDVALTLLLAGAQARATDERGRGVFHVMRHPASLALSAELLRAGADPELRDHAGQSPLEALEPIGLRRQLAAALRGAGRPVPTLPPTRAELFGIIARLGEQPGNAPARDDPEPVLALLEGNALLITEPDAEGRTALSEAAFNGLPRVVAALLARGSRVDEPDRHGRSALHRASDPDTIRLLARSGADLAATDNSGASPLHLRAATPGSLRAVQALIELGASTRSRDRSGQTPLDRARQSGSADVVAFLSQQG